MNFRYKALNEEGKQKTGIIDAASKDLAISALQRRNLIIVSIKSEDEKSIWQKGIFEKVPLKDIVIMSRQIATLFESQISALKAFTLISGNAENKLLSQKLKNVVDDLVANYGHLIVDECHHLSAVSFEAVGR